MSVRQPPVSLPAPVKQMRVVQLEYWDCGIEAHNHQTESVAAACMARRLHGTKRGTEEKIGRLLQYIQFGKRIIGGESIATMAKEVNCSTALIWEGFYRLIRKAASGQFEGITTLPPAKHLTYGVGIAAIRRNAAAWLERLAEVEATLTQQQSVPK